MKEGYLQLKMGELEDKLISFEERMFRMEEGLRKRETAIIELLKTAAQKEAILQHQIDLATTISSEEGLSQFKKEVLSALVKDTREKVIKFEKTVVDINNRVLGTWTESSVKRSENNFMVFAEVVSEMLISTRLHYTHPNIDQNHSEFISLFGRIKSEIYHELKKRLQVPK